MFKGKLKLTLGGIFTALFLTEIILRICGFGYKILNLQDPRISGKYNILCIGESTTMGIGAKDPSTQSYPRQLESMLNKRFKDSRIKVFYDITIGMNTSEILGKLPFYARRYEPNTIIIMCGVNNWWNLDKSNILLFNNNKHISDLGLRIRTFLDKSRLWKLTKWIRLSLGLYKERYDYEVASPEDEFYRINKMYGENIWDIFDKLAEYDISEMVKICKANNINVVMATYPFIAKKGLYVVHKEIAEDFGVPFVDNSFTKIPNRKDYLYTDNIHPNEKGYKLVAENIYKTIVENNILDIQVVP